MNTLTPHHLALEDSLGESLDRINAQAEAAVTRIEEMAAKADRRTAHEVARAHWRLQLSRIFGGVPLLPALAERRFTSYAEQVEIYSAYIAGHSIHNRGLAFDLGAPWHHDFPKEHASCSTP